MPRTRKRTKSTPSKKELATAEEDNAAVDKAGDTASSAACDTDIHQQQAESMEADHQTATTTDIDMADDEPVVVEASVGVVEDAKKDDTVEQMDNSESGKQTEDSTGQGMDEDGNVGSGDKTIEEKEVKEEESTPNKQNKKKPVVLYKSQSIPTFSSQSVIEKWEWHLKFFPIDQADIRSCVLESVSKIAQETWMYIDKNNYGMGTYELCVKSPNDAAMVMLKTLGMPLSYRYLTVEITKRGQNEEERERTSKGKESEETDEEDSDNLPYTEVLEKATLLLDFLHTPCVQKVKGQEKKRCLYVKYLPEGTTKEFLKVLFPVANNLDILTTGEGRRVGALNVSAIPNIIGICHAYVTVHIEQIKNISLDWHEENIDDGVLVDVAVDELPWEILPRCFEFPYENVPEMSEDDHIEYARRRRNLEETLKSHNPKFRDRERDRRWSRAEREREAREVSSALLLQQQQDMNEKISSQIALLQAVDEVSRAPPPQPTPSLLGAPPPLMPLIPPEELYRGRGERKERERGGSSGGKRSPDRRDRRDRGDRRKDRDGRSSRWDNDGPSRHERDRGRPERDRSSGRDRRDERPQRDEPKGRPDDSGRRPDVFDPRERFAPMGPGRFDHMRAGRFDDGDMGRGFDYGGRDPFEHEGRGGFEHGVRGGRFGHEGRGGPFEYEARGGRHFMDERRGFFEMEERGGHFDPEGRGREEHFDPEGRRGPLEPPGRRGRFEERGRGGRFDDRGRGQFQNFGNRGPPESPEMGRGRGGFGNRGRGRMEEGGRGGRFEDRGRGGRFNEAGRGGKFNDSSRGRNFEGKGRGGMQRNQGPDQFEEKPPERFDKGPIVKDTPVRGGHAERGGRGGHAERGGRGGHSERGGRDGHADRGGRGGHADRGGRGGYADRSGKGGGSGARGGMINTGKREGPGNQRGNENRGGLSGFGNQQQNPVQDVGAQKRRFTEQPPRGPGVSENVKGAQGNVGSGGNQGPGGNKRNMGNQPGNNTNTQGVKYGVQQAQGGMGNQGNFGNQSSNNQQRNMGMQGGFGNQQQNVGGGGVAYGSQTGNVNQGSYGSQQTTNNPQTSFGTTQNTNPQGGYRNQQSTMSNQSGFNNQQNTSMNQSGYNNQQGTGMPQGNFGNQQTSNAAQGNYNNQQNAYGSNQQSSFNNQQSNMNTQQNNYGMDQQGAYANQGYVSYGDNMYSQNYMGNQGYGNFSAAGDGSNMWAQNVDYSQYGTANYSATQTNTGQSFTSSGGQTQAVNTSATDTSSATGYAAQGANSMGYSADASYAAQGYYSTGQTSTGTTTYAGAYNTQDSTNSYASSMTNPANLATYNFASYNSGST